jgi:hypothetical protein
MAADFPNPTLRRDIMSRKTIGIALLVIGGLGMVVLLTYGGPVLPHLIGPTTVAIIGLVLLLLKPRAK